MMSGQEVVFEMPGTSRLPAELGDRVALGWNKADIFLFCTTGS
jgi:hypothetical protein